MSLPPETTKLEAELKQLESAFDGLTDSRIREITEIRIEDCRSRLRQMQATLRSNLKSSPVNPASCLDRAPNRDKPRP